MATNVNSDYKSLTPHEIRILDLMGESTWIIFDFWKKLFEEGINNFKEEFKFHRFLKKRPKLFGMRDTHVWCIFNFNSLNVLED